MNPQQPGIFYLFLTTDFTALRRGGGGGGEKERTCDHLPCNPIRRGRKKGLQFSGTIKLTARKNIDNHDI